MQTSAFYGQGFGSEAAQGLTAERHGALSVAYCRGLEIQELVKEKDMTMRVTALLTGAWTRLHEKGFPSQHKTVRRGLLLRQKGGQGTSWEGGHLYV